MWDNTRERVAIGCSDDMAITAGHRLLTGVWTSEVKIAEAAISRFGSDDSPTDCHILFFEVAGDARLHVSVTHPYATLAVRGWTGPGSTPDGFVLSRTFSGAQSRQMTRQIRDMVLATRS
jgi:hypothetical protein